MSPTAAAALRLSPIDAVHRDYGATFTEFAGWRLPLRFSGELAEHRAVREAAGLFDISHMGQIVVEGPGASAVLGFAVVSDVGNLAIGAARYTMLCEPDGGVVDDLIVSRLNQDEFLVVANATNTDAVLACLVDRADDAEVSIDDRTNERALYSIQGPNAARILATCLEDEDELPRRFHLRKSRIAGRSVLVSRTGYTGEDGFEISVAATDAEVVWQRLLGGNDERALLPAGLAARDSLRLEAGLPLYGHELSRERTPLAAGYAGILDFTHVFVGDTALADVARRGPEEVLVGLACSGQRSPRAGHVVHDLAGRPIGVVTSGGPSPTLGHPIAMAYITCSDAENGSKVTIAVRGREEPAELVSLPFYRSAKRPPLVIAPIMSGSG